MRRTTRIHFNPALAVLVVGAAMLVSGCATGAGGGSAADQRALADFIHSSSAASIVARGRNKSPVDVAPDEFGAAILGAPVPVLVEFWAPWCQPCRRMLPALQQVAREYSGRVRVARVNIDEAPGWAQRYRVAEIPALLIFNDGKLVKRRIGALPTPDLRAYLEEPPSRRALDPHSSASAGLR